MTSSTPASPRSAQQGSIELMSKAAAQHDASNEEQAITPSLEKDGDVLDRPGAVEACLDPLDKQNVDGGLYGWIVVACVFWQSVVLWGMNTTFGVYISFYVANDYFPGTTQQQYSFIGGFSLGCCFLTAPLSNYLTARFGFKPFMWVGCCCVTLGQIFAGLSNTFWQLILSQGALFGIGMGLVFVPAIPLLSQWFKKRRAMANGIAGAGSGVGALAWALETRVTIERLGLRWSFIINGLIILCITLPTTYLLRSRTKQIDAKWASLSFRLFRNYGFTSVCAYAFFSVLAYVTCLFSLATYSTQGLGFTQSQAAAIQALLATGQIIGRPAAGYALDRIGPANATILLSWFCGALCLLLWMFSRTFAPLAIFAILNGAVSGLLFSAAAPLCAEVISLQHLGSGLSIIWLVLVIPSTFSQAIAFALVDYSRDHLGRAGADAYLIPIGFAGAGFLVAGLVLLPAKRFHQGDWRIVKRA